MSGLQAIARLVLSCGVWRLRGEWLFDIAGLVRLGIVPEFLYKFHTYVSVIFVYTLSKHILYFTLDLKTS